MRRLAQEHDKELVLFVFDEFLHKVKLRPNKLVPCGTVEQYVEMIEDIYNYKRGSKVNLRF